MKRSILAVAVWYFVVMNGIGRPAPKGPFTSRISCETYRMRIARHNATSNCIQPSPKKK
jgi:hypothetical protein